MHEFALKVSLAYPGFIITTVLQCSTIQSYRIMLLGPNIILYLVFLHTFHGQKGAQLEGKEDSKRLPPPKCAYLLVTERYFSRAYLEGI